MNLSQSSCIICVVGFRNQPEQRSISPNGFGNKMMPKCPMSMNLLISFQPAVHWNVLTRLYRTRKELEKQPRPGPGPGFILGSLATLTGSTYGFNGEKKKSLNKGFESRGCALSWQNNVGVSPLFQPWIIQKAALLSMLHGSYRVCGRNEQLLREAA